LKDKIEGYPCAEGDVCAAFTHFPQEQLILDVVMVVVEPLGFIIIDTPMGFAVTPNHTLIHSSYCDHHGDEEPVSVSDPGDLEALVVVRGSAIRCSVDYIEMPS